MIVDVVARSSQRAPGSLDRPGALLQRSDGHLRRRASPREERGTGLFVQPLAGLIETSGGALQSIVVGEDGTERTDDSG